MSLVITRLRANEIIVGLGFTVAVAGFVRFILKSAYGVSGTYNPPGVVMLPRLDIPSLDAVPFLGRALRSIALTWLAWALVPAVAFALPRTRWGLRLRATGAAEATVRSRRASAADNPRRLDRFRRRACRGSPARTFRSASSASSTRESRAGAASSRWRPSISAAPRPSARRSARCCSAFFDAAQIRLQGRGVPAELVQMLPYVIVIVVLTGLGFADRRAARGGALIERAPDAKPANRVDPGRRHQFLLPRRDAEPLSRAPPRSLEPLAPACCRRRASAGRIVVHAVERHHPGFDDYEWRKLPRHHLHRRSRRGVLRRLRAGGPREIVCPKRRYSAFFATDLALFLREAEDRAGHRRGRQDQCLHSRHRRRTPSPTALTVVVPREATNSNRPHLAAASLEDIERYFGDVVSLERALEMLA